jgi:hypothetical protein
MYNNKIHLAKLVKLITKSHKTLVKDIKEDLNKT